MGKSGRGDQDRRAYPWGDAFDATRCNTFELGLGDTTPVGVFQNGASPYGCLDMAGNVWEWCEDWYDEAESRRVVRGGSFFYDRQNARCAFRYRNGPDLRDRYAGFRAALAGSP